MWKITRGPLGSWEGSPLEFARVTPDAAYKKANFRQAFLDDIAETLAALDLVDLFGIAINTAGSIAKESDQILLETTDSEKRLLTIKPEDQTRVDFAELTETLWIFSPKDQYDRPEEADSGDEAPEVAPLKKCTGQHCVGHCKFHCKEHCVAHCKDHKVEPVPPEPVPPGRPPTK
jgi:hypothetical protein